MKNEKMIWGEEENRESRRARRKRIERRQERDDAILIKNALVMFNDYNGDYRLAGANAG